MNLSATRIGRALLAVLVLPLVITPSTVEAVGRLPKCRLDNVMTVPRGYDDWSVTLVDWLLRVPRGYVPPDLVPVSEAGIAGPGLIRAVAIDDLRAMTRAAARNGTPIEVNSPYRSYQDQVASFNGWVGVDGYDDAITYSQRPGHSEHQLGLTIDFKSLGGPSALPGDWMTTPTGRWMYDNGWKFGWVLSYPRGEGGAIFSDATCFHYEPWHYRYLGREIARKVHRSGLTIREYLWKHYTRLTTDLEPAATPTPSPSPTPAATPSATASAPGSASAYPSAAATASPAVVGAAAGDGSAMAPSLLVAIGLAMVALIGFAIYAVRRGAAGSA